MNSEFKIKSWIKLLIALKSPVVCRLTIVRKSTAIWVTSSSVNKTALKKLKIESLSPTYQKIRASGEYERDNEERSPFDAVCVNTVCPILFEKLKNYLLFY